MNNFIECHTLQTNPVQNDDTGRSIFIDPTTIVAVCDCYYGTEIYTEHRCFTVQESYHTILAGIDKLRYSKEDE